MKECSSPLPSLRRSILSGLAVLYVASVCLAAPRSALAQPAIPERTSSTSIRTSDVDESIRWYRDKLGFRLIADQNFVQGRMVVLERSGFLLELTEEDDAPLETQDSHATKGAEATRAPVTSLLVRDVDEEVVRLRKAGVEILQEPQDELDGRYRTAQIRDNSRNRIELREPIDEGGFNPTGR